MEMERRYVNARQLNSIFGINFSKPWRNRLIRDGKFPAPIYLTARHPVWSVDAIQNWINQQAAEGRAADDAAAEAQRLAHARAKARETNAPEAA